MRNAAHPEAAPSGGYLDAASAEPLHPAARDTLAACWERGWADPRRLHREAREARLLLDNARAVVAECLDCRPDEVTFTASGTDAVHRGLLGLLRPTREGPRRLVSSGVEHSAVLHAARWAGVETLTAPVDRLGRVDADAVAELAGDDAVVALQTANHEVGTVQPVTRVAELLGPGRLFSDACASIGRLPLPDGWTTAAGSAHKWGGPAGVGVLLVRKGSPWRTPFPGDDQVDERGVGFANVPGALAAAAALQSVLADADEVAARQRALIDRIRTEVARIPDVEVVGDPDDRLPHLVTFSCLYVDGEVLVHALDRLRYGVASGSACTSSALEPSHVLAAMGALTHGNLRVSLTRDTTLEQVEGFLAALPSVVASIRAEAGV